MTSNKDNSEIATFYAHLLVWENTITWFREFLSTLILKMATSLFGYA